MAWTKQQLLARAAREVEDGDYLYLGRGLPQSLRCHIADDIAMWLLDTLGTGLVANSTTGHSAIFAMEQAFAMLQGGHVDLSILGALQVSEAGDLVVQPAAQRGLDCVRECLRARRVVVVMEHCDSTGASRIVPSCDLPLSGAGAVDRIITELGVIDVTSRGLLLVELAEDVSLSQIMLCTGVPLIVGQYNGGWHRSPVG